MLIRFTLLFAGLVLLTDAASGQNAKQAHLRWYGQSFFQLETSDGTKIVFDPHVIPQYGRPSVKADLILCSHEHNDHNEVLAVEGGDKAKVIRGLTVKGKTQNWAKIDEKFRNVRVRSVPSFHDEEGGIKRGKNTIFVVDADGLKFVHLGDLGHELEAEQIKQIGPVDVLMVPVGGIYTINGEKARKVVDQLKPRLFIIPMHCATKAFDDLLEPREFLDGFKAWTDLSDKTNQLSIPLDLKADSPKVILLRYQ